MKGGWKDDNHDGKGKMIYSNGDFYYGEWKNNHFYGVGGGRITDTNGVYEGEFKDGKKEGKGKMIYVTGGIYEGEWKNDLRNGKGKYIDENRCEYEGGWKDDYKSGKGRENYANGDMFEGDWDFDTQNAVGKGRITYEVGTYEGDIVDGNRHGIGKIIHTNGDIYEGQWADNLKTGIGKYNWKDGTIYEGAFINGKRNGKGKIKWADGNSYDGNWKDNKKNGRGKLISANGDILEGKWESDNYLEEISDSTKYQQPVAAVDTLAFGNSDILKMPDLIKIGNLSFPGSDEVIPAFIPFSTANGICYLVKDNIQKAKANSALQKIALRLLCSLPVNQVKFFIIDNEKNGMSFSGLFGLDKKILEPEIWDDESEITQGLTEIKNQVPVILTKYLQNKYPNLAEYNQKISHSNQPFQFLLIANFPRGFSKDAADKLLKLIENSNKAGIYVLMSIDTTVKMPYETSLNDFIKSPTLIDLELNQIKNVPSPEYFNSKFYITSFDIELPIYLEALKADINKAVNEVKTVELDISKHLSEEWIQSAAKGIKIPIGVTQSNEPLDFTFGFNSDVHHALIGGGTGSGKSVLLHNIIVNGSFIYSRDDLQFILLDYKEGTEFKIYESLPNVKILSIASEKEYGLSVFEFLAEEITRRGDLFKQFNAGNLAEYTASSGKKIPRYLVVIDEFQVLLSGSGSLSSNASALIEDISRRGRSFGINMILATQSLGDVDISSSTLSNIGLRIGMKMPEMDCIKILSMDNDAPLQFSRAGQAVYNTQNGLKSGNNLFQCAIIPKDKIAEKINYLADKARGSTLVLTPFKQYIYDGNQSVTIANNLKLQSLIKENQIKQNDNYCDIYLGEPSYLQEEHCKYKLRKQTASNVFIAGDDAEAAISVVYHSMYQSIKQSTEESRFYIFDLFDVDSGLNGQFEELKSMSPNCKVFSKDRPLEKLLDDLKDELDLRFNEEGNPGRYVISILNLQKIRELRKDGYDLTPLAAKLAVLLKDGADYGIHFLIHALNYNLLMECFESKVLNEFENVVVLKGEDPSRYIDDLSLSPIKNKSTAYLKSPNSRYKADIIKIYKK